MQRFARSASALVLLGLLRALAVVGAARAQAVRLGGEFQVSTYTYGDQGVPAVDMDSDGDFVVAWGSTQDGGGFGVFARRFNSLGTALASEFQVNLHTPGNQYAPAVGVDGDGDFVVAWQSYAQDAVGGYAIFARRFSSAGVGLATEFQVNAYVTSNQRYPAVGIGANGDFIVAWESFGQDGAGGYGVFARRYNSGGAAITAEFQVNSYTLSQQAYPAVAVAPSGFVVVWRSTAQDGDAAGVFARRFNSAGTGLATEFQVNVVTISDQTRPKVGMDAAGDFVVAWDSRYQDGQSFGVFARRFASTGAALGGEFQVNLRAASSQFRPDLAVLSNGDFVVVWQSDYQDGDDGGIFARRFNSAGGAPTGEFLVNTYTAMDQYGPVIAMETGGDFVVVWRSYYQDGSTYGLFAQRMRMIGLFDIDGDGQVMPLTDGLLALRFEFGFTGATLITGVVNLSGCTRCDASSIEAYLKSVL